LLNKEQTWIQILQPTDWSVKSGIAAAVRENLFTVLPYVQEALKTRLGGAHIDSNQRLI
jgi:hypothetical protein